MDVQQQRFQRWHITTDDPTQTRSVGVALPLTFLTIICTPLLGDSRWGGLVSIALIGGSALLTLNRSGVRGTIRHPATVVVALAMFTAATTSGVAGDDPTSSGGAAYWLHVTTLLCFALLLMLTPALMVLRLLMRPRITLDTVAGALTAYLQVGIFFAVLYRLIDVLGDDHFFAQGPEPVDSFQYFSLITLTTVGYGDLTPGTDLGQLLASLEALTGQLFLVSVVALVVGNLGRDLPHRRASASSPEPAGDTSDTGETDETDESGEPDEAGEA